VTGVRRQSRPNPLDARTEPIAAGRAAPGESLAGFRRAAQAFTRPMAALVALLNGLAEAQREGSRPRDATLHPPPCFTGLSRAAAFDRAARRTRVILGRATRHSSQSNYSKFMV
jgi:hypothetical protein